MLGIRSAKWIVLIVFLLLGAGVVYTARISPRKTLAEESEGAKRRQNYAQRVENAINETEDIIAGKK